MFAIYAFCRKVDDIADDGVGTRAERHDEAGQLARRSRRALCRRSRRRRPRSWRPRWRAMACARKISSPSSTAWTWTWPRISSRPISPRSIFIATGWRARWGGFRSRCSAWTRGRASSWRIIWAGRCSSPTSCATSTRTPPSAGSICRANIWTRPDSQSLDPETVIVRSARSTRSAARWPRWRIDHYDKAQRDPGGAAQGPHRARRA